MEPHANHAWNISSASTLSGRTCTRRAALFASAGLGLLIVAGSRLPRLKAADESPQLLRERAAAKHLLFGGATNWVNLGSDQHFADRVVAECGIVVPENDLKWDALRPSPDVYVFDNADAHLQWAQAHGLLIRGHTLVWHQQLPGWFDRVVDASTAMSTLTDHITTVVGHYAGAFHSWDVVNEVVEPTDGRPDGLRRTAWLRFLGPDYIPLAFETAAAADPAALLLLNENNIEYDRPEQSAKRSAVLDVLANLVGSRTPIDGLGIQAHLDGDLDTLKPEVLTRFLDDVGSLGLRVLITELDVMDQAMALDTTARDAQVARIYETFLDAVLPHKAVLGVLTWGLSDRYSWLNAYAHGADRLPARPLPLDADLRAKPAYYALASAFDNSPSHDPFTCTAREACLS